MNEKPICAITGSNGYVGGAVKKYLAAHGWEILELTRTPKPGTRSVAFQLGDELPAAALAGVTALIHCAYDFKPLQPAEIRRVNVEGSQKIFRSAVAARIPRLVFISSISAYDGCRSLYGKTKMEIETSALKDGALVIRPGLVYGPAAGGMFGRLVEQVRGSKVVPLIGDGSQIQYLVHAEDLSRFIGGFAAGKIAADGRIVSAAHPQPWPFRRLLEEIARGQGKKNGFLPLPWRLVWAGLKAAELCGMKLNFRSDSLVSLMYQNPRPDFSANEGLGLRCRPFEIKPEA